MFRSVLFCFLLAFSLLLVGCGLMDSNAPSRFELIDAEEHGITFRNQLSYTEQMNPYSYKSFFNGGGVGLSDLDQDGLIDIILTGNLVNNGIYRNLGNWQFEDVSRKSNLLGEAAWTSGVAIADVNGDGLPDVYLCKSGMPMTPNRNNELLINKGNFIFENVAKAAGVDDYGFGVQASFFDYDKDGDLDMYLLNNSIRAVGGYDIRPGQRDVPDNKGGNKLYRNMLVENGALTFEDVTEEAGIYNSAIGFGLGVTVADVDQDGWSDLYVSNDFFERDYLYFNKGDGTFDERLTELAPELSLGAMGADVADMTGDGYPEIFVTEMRPRSARRIKSKTKFETWDKAKLAEDKGYHRQFGRNTFLHNINGEALVDISRQAGVASTDWSWGALAVDLDNDGWRDLFVANGIYKDLLDQDYINFIADPANIKRWIDEGSQVVERLVDSMPSEIIGNFAFKNVEGSLAFADSSSQWGLDLPSFSNGSGYADLDNDGDLDLVINTLDAPPLLYKNKSREINESDNAFIGFSFRQPDVFGNFFGLGTVVEVYAEGKVQYGELSPFRGFMSTVDDRLFFGLSSTKSVDSIIVKWPSDLVDRYTDLEVNKYHQLSPTGNYQNRRKSRLKSQEWQQLDTWSHVEMEHDDFDRYPLMMEMFSAEGPASAAITFKGKSWLFVGGGRGQAAKLFSQTSIGFRDITPVDFSLATPAEDVKAEWVDVDSDGDPDLFVASGGNEESTDPTLNGLRLYINESGTLRAAGSGTCPSLSTYSCGALKAWDADNDGDQDLFYGTHYELDKIGIPAPSFILLNDGTGKFQKKLVVEDSPLQKLSRVRSSMIASLSSMGSPDLVVGQEYGPVSILEVVGDEVLLTPISSNGLWRSLLAIDLDGDGIDEIAAGNLGTNTVFEVSDVQPLRQHVGDFDGNGQLEHLSTYWLNGEETLTHQLFDLFGQMPSLRKKFPRFKDYASASLYAVLDTTRRLHEYRVEEVRSGLIKQDGENAWSFSPFHQEVQSTCIRAIDAHELDGGAHELFFAGNYNRVKPEIGGHLAGTGVALIYENGTFKRDEGNRYPPLFGEVRGLHFLGDTLIAVRNNAPVLVYQQE